LEIFNQLVICPNCYFNGKWRRGLICSNAEGKSPYTLNMERREKNTTRMGQRNQNITTIREIHKNQTKIKITVA